MSNEDDYDADYIALYEHEVEEKVYAIRPNKTQIKKEIAEVAEIAEQLVQLTPAQLQQFELPDVLLQAIMQTEAMPPKGARKRQLKYITAQLRQLDMAFISEQLARLKNKSVHGVREHHQAEQWRDRLIADSGNTALTELLDTYPDADSQQLRQLQRSAKKELAENKPPKSARLLYRYLKTLFETAMIEHD